jgi:hypothetical protein
MAHALGKFVFNEKDCARLFLLQEHGFLFVVCADDRFDPRIERAGDFEHLPHVKGVGWRSRRRGRAKRAKTCCARSSRKWRRSIRVRSSTIPKAGRAHDIAATIALVRMPRRSARQSKRPWSRARLPPRHQQNQRRRTSSSKGFLAHRNHRGVEGRGRGCGAKLPFRSKILQSGIEKSMTCELQLSCFR